MEFIPIIFGAIVLYVVINLFIKSAGKALSKKFVSLGNMKGMDLNELVKKVGRYKAVRNLPDGRKVCVWQEPGYMISLVIDIQNKVESVGSEASV